MKQIASRLKDQAFTEHIETMQLALFGEKKLNANEEEEVFKHLAQCRRCRDVLKVASELKIEHQKKREPLNNINYKKFVPLALVSSLLLTIGTIPALQEYPDETSGFKDVFTEKSFIDKTIYYWECRFDEIFNGE